MFLIPILVDGCESREVEEPFEMSLAASGVRGMYLDARTAQRFISELKRMVM
jgi:hypothetical protein